jgi:hypothetical protein
MAKAKKDTAETTETNTSNSIPLISSLDWTDYVLSQLSDDEKISGNPTTDGLRRIFENILNCTIININTDVVQAPSPENEKRATVVYRMDYVLNDESTPIEIKSRSVTGAADVYWGNCDKIYRNHPVAVAETRAEGRALRKALRLRKVVAAEEIAKDIEDHPDHDTISKITNNQINFIDVLSKRLDVNVTKLLEKLDLKTANVYNIGYQEAVDIVQTLTNYQQANNTPSELIGYSSDWK